MPAVRPSYRRSTFDARDGALFVAGCAAIGVLALVLAHLVVAAVPLAVLAAVAVLMLGLGAVDLRILVMLSVPATLVMVRVGGFLSVSDVVLAGATVLALLMVKAEEIDGLRPLVWAGVGYLACLVPTLVLFPYSANFVEWAHEAVLILGSLVVGFVIGREGYARSAYSLYTVLSCVMAVAALVAALVMLAEHGHFGPAYLPFLNKNFIGDSLAVTAVLVYARPPWIGWTRAWCQVALVTSAVGIAASGSRQAMVSAAVGILIVNLRPRIDTGRRGRLIYFALIPATIFVINAVATQLHSDNVYNSANQRLMWFAESITIWKTSPLLGVGLRWWYTGRFPQNFQPPNAEFEMLTSGGLVGLTGFVVMFCVAAWVLTRLDPRYGTLALAVVICRFTQGQFDLYWVAGQASLLWIVAGTAFGVQQRELRRAGRPSDQPSDQPSDRPPPLRVPPERRTPVGGALR